MAFFELNIGMSGLFAAKRGLQVTSNNISNANTTGYSRQVLSQEASTPLSGLNVGMTGTGVTTTGVNRIRDSYIDQKIWAQNGPLGEYNMKVTQNSMIEVAFNEPSDDGFTKVYSDMFNAISSLSNDPTSNDKKIVLREQMATFAKYFNNISETLQKQQKDLNIQIKGVVDEVNSLATRIRSLNEQIFKAEIYGDEASSFRDERDKCIDRLSEITNVDVTEEEYQVQGNTIKKCTVRINGQVLVDHLNGNTLKVKPRATKQNPEDQDGLYDIEWSTGAKFDLNDSNTSGELKGLVDMRDGAGTGSANSYVGVPYYIKRLDNYVRGFAKAMNNVYCEQAADSTTPIDRALFSYTEGTNVPVEPTSVDFDYSKMTAANFSVSKELLDNPNNMKTSSDPNNPHDTTFMRNLLEQKNNKRMFNEGDPQDYMTSIFAELGINAKESEMYQSTQVAVTNNLKNQRLSVSQVDITEEFTYLVQYQQAYQAAAKIMTTIDGIYETTIFKLGNF